jgi:hypothetical protein
MALRLFATPASPVDSTANTPEPNVPFEHEHEHEHEQEQEQEQEQE